MLEYTNYSIDISNAQKESIFDACDFSGLTIKEAMNQVPYFELDVFCTEYNKILDSKTLQLQYQSEVCNYTAPLGINVVRIDKNVLKIYGWLTEWENFKTSNTQYLANNLRDAIIATNIRKDIRWNNNFSGNFFQVNTCNMQQCLDLCLAAASTPYWCIGRTSIILEKSNSEEELDLPDNISVEYYSQDADTEVTSENSSMGLYTGGFYKNSTIFSDSDLASCFENCLYNYKRKDLGLKYYLSFTGTAEYKYSVGTLLNNPLSNLGEVTNWVVVSVVYFYDKNGISCKVTMGGIT